jgi:hypothetical protein
MTHARKLRQVPNVAVQTEAVASIATSRTFDKITDPPDLGSPHGALVTSLVM